MYVEASLRRRGDNARLITPVMAPTTGTCLRFWYHMHGTQMGTLRILVNKKSTPSVFSSVWSQSGNHANKWLTDAVTIRSSSNFSIVFEGIVGSGFSSDIALDDISFQSGLCPLPGKDLECNCK